MTYKETISLFRSRYRRYALNKGLPELEDGEILAELSVIQEELQNQYYLVLCNSQLLSVPQFNITAGQDTYEMGSGAGNIPNNIMEVRAMFLNDVLKTELLPINVPFMRDTIKPVSKPYYYFMYMDNQTMRLELDAIPDTNYVVTMYYIPRFDMFAGNAGTNSNIIWNDYTNAYLGNWKLPLQWHSILVDGALANVLGLPQLYEIYESKKRALLNARPTHDSGDIPEDDMRWNKYSRRVLPPGYDIPYGGYGINYYW